MMEEWNDGRMEHWNTGTLVAIGIDLCALLFALCTMRT